MEESVKRETTGSTAQKQWLSAAASVACFAGVTIGLTVLLHSLSSRFSLPIYGLAWVAYFTVFAANLVSNLTIMTPVPLALSVTLAAAEQWNPMGVALAAAVGASIGELSGYAAGLMGRKVLLRESFMCQVNKTFCIGSISQWVSRHGAWAIGGLALQPILPFDIAGILAGAARMPVLRFFGAMLAGKTVKFIILSYFAGALALVPFFSFK